MALVIFVFLSVFFFLGVTLWGWGGVGGWAKSQGKEIRVLIFCINGFSI